MKHTIAQNKQLFNVKQIANRVHIDNLVDGQFGVYKVGNDTSITATTTYASLPDEFRFISKLGGKVYFSFDTIKKSEMRNFAAKAYKPETINIWEATVEHCDCIKSALLKIGIEEESLIRQNGLTWTDTDSTVQNAPKELSCFCDCSGKSVYDNNIMTKALSEKINVINSPFYESVIKLDVSDLTTYANQAALDAAVPTPAQGDLAITDEGTVQYDGAAWIVVGTVVGVITDVDTFIATNKTVNTDEDETNDKEKLILVIQGKLAGTRNYKDLDVNHIFPRGAKLFPSITLNEGNACIEFTETQEIGYELGAGADVRAEEFDCMSLYTNLNHYPQLHDGIASENLIYQFENGVQYNTIDFEFYTDKVNKNDGDKRSFGVMLGAEDAGVFAALQTMLSA